VAIIKACREWACQKEAYQKGAYKEEAYHKGACCKKGGISSRVSISGKAGIGVSSRKDIFRSFRLLLLLHKALSIVYSRGVGK
jgi:hypothetical protein